MPVDPVKACLQKKTQKIWSYDTDRSHVVQHKFGRTIQNLVTQLKIYVSCLQTFVVVMDEKRVLVNGG
jgi:IS1 family transposase